MLRRLQKVGFSRNIILYSVSILLMILGLSIVGTLTYNNYRETAKEKSLKERLLKAYYIEQEGDSNKLEHIAPQVENPQNTEVIEADKKRTSKLRTLKGINNEIVGWIKIDGTQIDYPLLKHSDNDYYLNVNAAGEKSSHGSIFVDYRTGVEPLKQNTIIYGHNMTDGSMFGALEKYKDKDFFNNHRDIILETSYGKSVWEVFSVYPLDAQKDELDIYFENNVQYRNALDRYINNSIFISNIFPKSEERIITLVTCSYETNNARFVVQAVEKKH